MSGSPKIGAVADTPEQVNHVGQPEKGQQARGGVPRELIYPGIYYFFSQLGQRLPFGAISSLTVFLWDHGYRESEIALVKLCAGLPFVVKIVPALLLDRRPFPWKGNALSPSGRWRPAVVYSTAFALVMMLVFAFMVGHEPDSGTTPSIEVVAGLGFLTMLGVSTSDAALDAHTCELVARFAPDYLPPGESMKPWAGRVLGTKTLGALFGFVGGILYVTQVGPAWSYMGALALLAAPMLPTLLMLPWLKDATQPPPNLPQGEWEEGKFTCASFLDRVLARGPNAERFRIVRAGCAANFLIYMVFGGWESVATAWAKKEWDITSQEDGAARTIATICWVLGGLINAPLGDFCGPARVVTWAVVAALLVLPFNWVMFEYGLHWVHLLPSTALLAMASGCATEANGVLITVNVPAASPAGSFAVASLPSSLGYGASAILLAVAQKVSYAAALAVLIALGALATVVVWTSIRGVGDSATGKEAPATLASDKVPEVKDLGNVQEVM